MDKRPCFCLSLGQVSVNERIDLGASYRLYAQIQGVLLDNSRPGSKRVAWINPEVFPAKPQWAVPRDGRPLLQGTNRPFYHHFYQKFHLD